MLIDGITMCSNVLPDPKIKITINPVKEITDEEIWKLWQKHLDDEIPVFARAILRKAQGL